MSSIEVYNKTSMKSTTRHLV